MKLFACPGRSNIGSSGRSRLLVLAVCSTLIAATACGSDSVQGLADDGPGVESPGPESPDGSLSFERIAGDWEGMGREQNPDSPQFWIEVTLDSAADPGERVGSIRYGNFGDVENPACRGGWFAQAAEGGTYTFTERVTFGGCVDGTVVLTLDPNGTLDYVFTAESGDPDHSAEGTLHRPI